MESQSPQNSFHIPRHFLSSILESPIADRSFGIPPELRLFIVVSIRLALLLLLFTFFWCMLRSTPQNEEHQASSLDEELAVFPVTVYRGGSAPEAEDCAICLEEYEIGDKIRVLPRCKHLFHKDFLEKWVQVPSLHCPICRDKILERLIQQSVTNCRIARNYPVVAFQTRNAI